MRNHELDLPNHENSRDKIAAIQELFLKLNNQDEAGVIATYQTAKSLAESEASYNELCHLQNVQEAAEARMLALVASSADEAERRRLTDTFCAVLNKWWFAKTLWDRWESERRAQVRAQFWSRIISFFKRRGGTDTK